MEYVSTGIATLEESMSVMNSVLSIFPKSSYKYNLLIPVMALLIEGQYQICGKTYVLTDQDKMYLESITFVRDKEFSDPYHNSLEQWPIDCFISLPDFTNLGRAASIIGVDPDNAKDAGFHTHMSYIASKRYITMQFQLLNGSITTANYMKIGGNLNEFVSRVCNFLRIQNAQDVLHILNSTRVMINPR